MKDLKDRLINERSEWRFEDIQNEIQSLTNSLFYDKGLKGDAACYPINDGDQASPTNEVVLTHFFNCIKEVLDKWNVKFEYTLK